MTDQELKAEDDSAEDAAIRGAVRQGVERAAGVSAVEIGRAGMSCESISAPLSRAS